MIVLIKILSSGIWEFQSFHILISTCYFQSVITAFWFSLWIPFVVLTWMSLMRSDIKHLFFACWLFGCRPWFLLIYIFDCLSCCVGVLDVFCIWFLSGMHVENIFSKSVCLTFSLFLISKIQLEVICFILNALGNFERWYSMFFPKVFIP